MPDAICIAVVGAESTGKTTLAAELALQLAAQSGRRVAWVSESLRDWCQHQGRTPLAHEQADILRAHHQRIEAAAATHDVVVCDTTALMTAVYSQLLFGDTSLHAEAAALHRRHQRLTLLTALDLPWVADGLQRDGAHVREPVDTALRELMIRHAIDFSVVGGAGAHRLDQALAATAPLLHSADLPARSPGLFSALQTQNHGQTERLWRCECCLPEEERALRQRGRIRSPPTR